ncbi:MAG: hypothetical protein IT186_13085 [Acidobacteria bacterium]|nr:hypothetical protein [Acidobacteriota bacterium]MCG3192635.1 hypothetical protein [Thermoanaerobaculia bacterium]
MRGRRRGATLLVALAILVALSILGLSLMLSTARVTAGTRELMRFRDLSSAEAVLELLKASLVSQAISPAERNLPVLRSRWASVWEPAGGNLDRFELLTVRPDGTSDLGSGSSPAFLKQIYLVKTSSTGDQPVQLESVLEIRGQPFEAASTVSSPLWPRERRVWVTAGPEGCLEALEPDLGGGSQGPGVTGGMKRLWDVREALDFASGYAEPLKPGALLRSLGGKGPEKVSFWPGRNLLDTEDGRIVRARTPVAQAPGARTPGVQTPGAQTLGRAPALSATYGPPQTVKAPGQVWFLVNDILGYPDFAWKQRNRRPVVLAASDVADVHAFDLETGSEAFAFPGSGSRIGGPAALSVADVFIDAAWAGGGADCARLVNRPGTHCQWRTLAFVPRSRGGLFALDLTQPDPEAATANAPGCLADPSARPVLLCSGPYPALAWEAPPEKLEDSAAAMGRPAIGRLEVRPRGETLPKDRFVVFVSGGFDPKDVLHLGKNVVPANRKGAVLYALDAGTGEILFRWDRGVSVRDGRTEERRFAALPGGASLVDSNGDGSVDAVFFGDLNGSIWLLRLEDGLSEESVAELVFDGETGDSGTPECAGKNANGVAVGCGGERGVSFPPVVFTHPRGSYRRLGVAWVTAGGPLEAFRKGPAEVVSIPVQTGRTQRRGDLLDAGSLEKRETVCGKRPGPISISGFRAELPGSEEPESGLSLVNGYLVLGTRGAADGGRLYRVEMRSGAPCAGADCCPESAAFWPETNGVFRTGPAAGTSVPRVFPAKGGGVSAGVIRGEGRNGRELVERPLGLILDETETRER